MATLFAGEPTAVIAKVTIVLLGAAITVGALRRASAAARHLTWLLGLSACAALALLLPAAPTIAVGVTALNTSRGEPNYLIVPMDVSTTDVRPRMAEQSRNI